MAVPARPNGLEDEDEEEEEEGIFGEEELEIDINTDTAPPHLRALAQAARLGNVDTLRDALDNLTGNIDEPVEDGDTALHLTCLYGYLPCVQLLLERGASMDAKDEDGAIPMHDACAGGFAEIVQLLINSASNPDLVNTMLNTADAEGDTPLHHAARGEHVEVVRLLLAAGASPTKANIYRKSPIDLTEPETEVKRILETSANGLAC